jgi:putative membrane protein insertion efficiency factor
LESSRKNTLVARLLLGAIVIYRMTFSAFAGRRCRYLPTCSDYSAEAISRFGAWRGSWLALSRVTRCHPWGGEGFDPVPYELPDVGWRVWRLGRWRLPK